MGLSYQVDEASLVTAAALRPSTGLTAYACVKSMEIDVVIRFSSRYGYASLHPIRKDDLTVSTTDGVERVANVS